MQLLGFTTTETGRFRDCYLQRGVDGLLEIHVFTRNGGGNRPDYVEQSQRLMGHPSFVREFDDDFDTTYRSYVNARRTTSSIAAFARFPDQPEVDSVVDHSRRRQTRNCFPHTLVKAGPAKWVLFPGGPRTYSWSPAEGTRHVVTTMVFARHQVFGSSLRFTEQHFSTLEALVKAQPELIPPPVKQRFDAFMAKMEKDPNDPDVQLVKAAVAPMVQAIVTGTEPPDDPNAPLKIVKL